ncbi:MAG: hypothetical protein NZ782_01120 [Candidatus Poseidoniia archaeon]|nr:hypothetical protein [Candidatus Poseidoniia archaeon]
MSTIESVVAEIASGAEYINQQTELAIPDFDLTACRASAVRTIVTQVNAVPRIDSAGATTIIKALRGSAFDPNERRQISTAVSGKQACSSTTVKPRNTAGKQTFATKSASHNYFTESDWVIFQDASKPWKLKVHTALKRLRLAGFHNGSGSSYTDIAVAIGECEWPNGSGDADQLFGLKTFISSSAASMPVIAPHLAFLQVFPCTPGELDDDRWRNAYTLDDSPVVGKLVDWEVARRRYSTRGTNKHVRESVAAKGGKCGAFVASPSPPPTVMPSASACNALVVPGSAASPRVTQVHLAGSVDPMQCMQMGAQLLQQGCDPKHLQMMMNAMMSSTGGTGGGPSSGTRAADSKLASLQLRMQGGTGAATDRPATPASFSDRSAMGAHVRAPSPQQSDDGHNDVSPRPSLHHSKRQSLSGLLPDPTLDGSPLPSDDDDEIRAAEEEAAAAAANLVAARTRAAKRADFRTSAAAPRTDPSSLQVKEEMSDFDDEGAIANQAALMNACAARAVDASIKPEPADATPAPADASAVDSTRAKLSQLGADMPSISRRRITSKTGGSGTYSARAPPCDAATVTATTPAAATAADTAAPTVPPLAATTAAGAAAAAPERLSVKEMQRRHQQTLKESAEKDKEKRADDRKRKAAQDAGRAKVVAAAVDAAKAAAAASGDAMPPTASVEAAAAAAYDAESRNVRRACASVPSRCRSSAAVVKTEPAGGKVVKAEPSDSVSAASEGKATLPKMPSANPSPRIDYNGGWIYTSFTKRCFRAIRTAGAYASEKAIPWGSPTPTETAWEATIAAIDAARLSGY